MNVNPFSMTRIELDADESDEDCCHYEFDGKGRLILDTVHGKIIIDIRARDVNAFTFVDGKRVDHLLIP
jgi:hypothetical protein